MYRLFNPKSATKNRKKNGIRIRINVVKFTITSFCIQNIIVLFHEWVCRKKQKSPPPITRAITTTKNVYTGKLSGLYSNEYRILYTMLLFLCH